MFVWRNYLYLQTVDCWTILYIAFGHFHFNTNGVYFFSEKKNLLGSSDITITTKTLVTFDDLASKQHVLERILDVKMKHLHSKIIWELKIKWIDKSIRDATWERDQLTQIMCNMAFSLNSSYVAPTTRFQMDQSRSEHQVFGVPNWFQHTDRDYDCARYPFHLTKVDTLEFEKTVASGSHHSGKPDTTRNNMVQSIMLDNFQWKYTLDSMISTQLHLVW